MSELVPLVAARRALAEIETVEDAKALRDKAEAARVWARNAQLGLEAQNHCAEIKLAAERKAAERKARELLAETPLDPGGWEKSQSRDATTSLSDLGVSKTQSSRWQALARIPADAFEHEIERTKESGEELTAAAMLKVAQRHRAQPSPAPPLPEGEEYRCIVADPPWTFRNPGATLAAAQRHYPTMTLDELRAPPVERAAAADAHLWVWGVNGLMEHAHAVVRAWGFEPLTIVTWHKPRPGVGHYLRNSTEHVILASRGRPLVPARKPTSTCYKWPAREHSRKPDELFQLVEQVSPGPYLELFARRKRAGWTTWGNELASGRGVAA